MADIYDGMRSTGMGARGAEGVSTSASRGEREKSAPAADRVSGRRDPRAGDRRQDRILEPLTRARSCRQLPRVLRGIL